jgi:quercetin dioxygenase-like cupin family protein
MKPSLLLLFLFISFYTKAQTPIGTIQLTQADMQWKDGPPTLPAGTKVCLLYGDTKKEGPFALRVMLPANSIIKLHIHQNDEVVTVLEGRVTIGYGEDRELIPLKNFGAGSFYVNAAGLKHFVMAGNEGVTLQINSMGPWTLEFK